MCGIAGIMYKSSHGAETGQALIDMLDGCQHRGPDSTGFALCGDAARDQLRLRFFIGEGAVADAAVARVRDELEKQGARIVDAEIIANNYRVTVEFTGDLQQFAYATEHNAKVISIGASLEITKDVGGAHEVDERYQVAAFQGTHGLGHVRLANFMAGYLMYGGRIIILGNSGERIGEDMSAGEIFVAGKLGELGADAKLTDTSDAEIDDIREFLDRYEIKFAGGFQKIVNAGTKLQYAKSEEQVRSIPYCSFSGESAYWNPKIQENLHIKAQIGRYRIRGYGGARPLPHLADLAFKSDLRKAGDVIDPVSKVDLRTELDGLNGANPLQLSMRVLIAPMSYGALSASTKRAIGLASTFIDLRSPSRHPDILGADSADVIDYVGTPTLSAIVEAIDALEGIGRRQDIEIVLMGGLRDGIDAAKALALGADAIAFGTAAIIAGGASPACSVMSGNVLPASRRRTRNTKSVTRRRPKRATSIAFSKARAGKWRRSPTPWDTPACTN